jgi:hypothetical protein
LIHRAVAFGRLPPLLLVPLKGERREARLLDFQRHDLVRAERVDLQRLPCHGIDAHDVKNRLRHGDHEQFVRKLCEA